MLAKAVSGPVVSADLGRTAQITAIQSYDGVLDTSLNAVSAPGWVRRTLANGTGFYVETVDGAGQLADRAFGFTAILI